MQQQSAKMAALYYRVANKKTDGVFFDNQICKLLCYATERGIENYTLYADIGRNGIAPDRPALNALKTDIQAGRIDTVILCGVDRLFRDYLKAVEFIEWARPYGVEFINVIDGEPGLSSQREIAALCRRFPKGGERQ